MDDSSCFRRRIPIVSKQFLDTFYEFLIFYLTSYLIFQRGHFKKNSQVSNKIKENVYEKKHSYYILPYKEISCFLGASFSHNPTSQPNSMDMNAYTAPRGPGFQSQQPPQNMNEGFGALPAHQGGFNSG